MPQSALADPGRIRSDQRPARAPEAGGEPPVIAPRSADGLWVSEEEYWRDYYLESDLHYEWNNGRLEEKPVSDYETFLVYHWLMALLSHFLTTHPIARLVALEMGFRLPLPTGTVIRKPDFGVVRNDNPQPLLPLDVSYHGVFDLCVEALSDRERRDIERDAVVKKAEYAAGGVPEYYILHRDPARQAFYARNASGLYVGMQPREGVLYSSVLPGFQFRVEDLCRRPEHASLRTDPVYAHYVLPGWREAEERERAQAERAEAETKARLAAEQRARAAEQALERLQAELAARSD